MMGDSHHVRRIRLYEFAYVVPWGEIVAQMERGTSSPSDTGGDR